MRLNRVKTIKMRMEIINDNEIQTLISETYNDYMQDVSIEGLLMNLDYLNDNEFKRFICGYNTHCFNVDNGSYYVIIWDI